MIASSLVTILIPVWILLGILALMGVLALVGRIQNGRYLRPIITVVAKVPLFKRGLEKASRAAIERSNPDLASAMRKVEPHAKRMHDPQHAQKVLSRLTREERRALMEMQDQQQGDVIEEASNRQMRRRMEKARRDAQRKR